MNLELLKQTASAMVAPGKGILAIDESMGTCKRRFDGIGVECNEESRRAYRDLLVSAPGIEAYVSGYILFDETLRQATTDGVAFPKVLEDKGIIPGIKVDKKAHELALHSGEKVTEGLDGLRDRLVEYKELGARFAKWRAVIKIEGDNLPSAACVMANAHALARYAALCQEADVVPMVEPEILIDGDHSIEKCYEVTANVLKTLFSEMEQQGVAPEGAILKVSMVTSGKALVEQAGVEEVADMTVKCLKENVPHDLAGVVFLSGGQSNEKSTAHLNMMNKKYKGDLPWPLSFSYGRAIQSPALQAWGANQSDVAGAQAALVERAKLNGLAATGDYDASMEA